MVIFYKFNVFCSLLVVFLTVIFSNLRYRLIIASPLISHYPGFVILPFLVAQIALQMPVREGTHPRSRMKRGILLNLNDLIKGDQNHHPHILPK